MTSKYLQRWWRSMIAGSLSRPTATSHRIYGTQEDARGRITSTGAPADHRRVRGAALAHFSFIGDSRASTWSGAGTERKSTSDASGGVPESGPPARRCSDGAPSPRVSFDPRPSNSGRTRFDWLIRLKIVLFNDFLCVVFVECWIVFDLCLLGYVFIQIWGMKCKAPPHLIK